MEIVKNVTEMANRGKTEHIDAVNRSKNVVGIGEFYYCGFLINNIISMRISLIAHQI